MTDFAVSAKTLPVGLLAKNESFLMNKRQKFARLAAFGAAAGAGGSAFAVDPATALEALGTLSTSATGFGPIMFGLAVTVTGIMIGVKWIKRGKGAA